MVFKIISLLLISTEFVRPNRVLAPEYERYDYAKEFEKTDLDQVRADLVNIFKSSQSFWPADFNHYGPLMIRLAWHAAGTYRRSDGRGGADGARQRFVPENSWMDNTNLDKARKLLEPVKQKYGKGLSWGDLIVLAGDTAMESMGFQTFGFCGGRLDERDGRESILLGPNSDFDESAYACEVDGDCEEPMGATTKELIYVNPEGHMGNPDPSLSFPDIQCVFGRMEMNEEETVALIAGGHAFGKTHGPCPEGVGPSPKDILIHGNGGLGWEGLCGVGKGADSFTSGFEGAWTTKPTTWDHEYIHNLLNFEWEKKKGPGGHWQWKVKGKSPMAPHSNNDIKVPIMMLTSDVSLTYDPVYKAILQNFAKNPEKFETAFRHAWYKLMTHDMGPVTRCLGNDVPPAQLFQDPIPIHVPVVHDYSPVKNMIIDMLSTTTVTHGELVRLAWQCASTFRFTDYRGGCNGARIRFLKKWESNKGIDYTLSSLNSIKSQFSFLTWADLIVLSGSTAIEHAATNAGFPTKVSFCPGRMDALADQTDIKSFKVLDRASAVSNFPLDIESIQDIKESAHLMGLDTQELVALVGGVRSLGAVHPSAMEYLFTDTHNTLSNDYFLKLLSNVWESIDADGVIYTSKAGLKALRTDLFLQTDFSLASLSQSYAADQQMFITDFSKAWEKVMNADRFDGPTKNICSDIQGWNLTG